MNGFYLQGEMKGYIEKPWANDPTKFNRQVGIVTRVYDDQWGQKQENVQSVDIPYELADQVKQIANDLIGKTVVLPVVPSARKGGRDGAWLSVFMPKDGTIREVKKPAPVKAA
ncbi:MAG: DNA-binding protein [Sedimenticola sp.]